MFFSKININFFFIGFLLFITSLSSYRFIIIYYIPARLQVYYYVLYTCPATALLLFIIPLPGLKLLPGYTGQISLRAVLNQLNVLGCMLLGHFIKMIFWSFQSINLSKNKIFFNGDSIMIMNFSRGALIFCSFYGGGGSIHWGKTIGNQGF